jgi:ABC-type dipeptide/oligopeptide/nickel transport system permease component
VSRYLLRRLLLLVPVLLGVSVVVFLVLHLSPGDPAEIMLGSQASQEDVTRLRASLGLDEPLPAQYVR